MDNPEKMVTWGTKEKQNKKLENTEGAIQMDNPEKMVTWGTKEKQNKNTTQKTRTIPIYWEHLIG